MSSMIKYNLDTHITNPDSVLTEHVSSAVETLAQNYPNWSKYLDTGLRDLITRQARWLVTKDIVAVAKVAGKHGGVIYGGFVRDFLIRQEDATDLDLWFKTQDQADAFVTAMVEVKSMAKNKFRFRPSMSNQNDQCSEMYPFVRTQYLLESFETEFSYFVDVVVSAEFPVNDFVNNLVLAKVSGDELAVFTEDCIKVNLKTDNDRQISLITLTKQGVLKAMPGFLPKKGQSGHSRKTVRLVKFLKRGWTIVDNDNTKLVNKSVGFSEEETKVTAKPVLL